MIKYVLIAVAVFLILWVIGVYNRLIRLRELYNNALAQISPQLESRWDAISSMIAAIGKYSAHEKETLESVVGMRTNISKSSSIEDMKKDDAMYEKALGAINVVVENYPEIKASELYKTAMDSINHYEDKVRHARMILQDTATKYNIAIRVFPANLIAGMLGFYPVGYFEHTQSKSDMPSWN